MIGMDLLAGSPWMERVGWTLVHFLWQGAAVGMALAFALASLRQHGPAARYAACLGALTFLALLPLATLGFMAFEADFSAQGVGEGDPRAEASAPSGTRAIGQEDRDRTASAQYVPGVGPSLFSSGRWTSPRWMPWVVLGWLVGVCTLTLRLLGGWVQIEMLRRRLVEPVKGALADETARLCAQLGVTRRVRVLRSALAQTPLTFGWLRPVVLLPASALTMLTPAQVQAILAHELAHVCRNDFLVNVFQTVVETLLFYHPVVWWVSHRMRTEREYCCDDLAAAATGSQLDYARALADLEAVRHAVLPGLATAATGGHLLRRIRRIVEPTHVPSARTEWLWGALAAALVVLLLGGALRMTTVTAAPQGAEATDAPGSVVASAPSTEPQELFGVTTDAPLERGGVVLLDFERIGSAERLGDTPEQLHALVGAALADSAGVRLVDRAVLDQAMAEQRLARAGLAHAATAARIGKLVGARTLVDGKLMQLDPEWVFTARLIDVETSVVSGLRVTGKTEDGLLDFAEAVGSVLARRLAELAPPSRVGETDDAFAPQIAALREKLAGQALPRLAVRVPEMHIGTFVPDPAGENELMRVLGAVGFPIVDVDQFMEREQSSWWTNLFFGPDADGAGHAGGLRQGWRDPAVILHNARLARLKEKADLFIVGEAFSEFVGEQYGFQSCQARIEVKVLDTHTEAVTAADSRHATAADLGEFIAGKKALRQVGGELALAIAETLAVYWESQQQAVRTTAP